MIIRPAMPRLKGFLFHREVTADASWALHRVALRMADVEDLLAERGVIVSREAIRRWVNRFIKRLIARFGDLCVVVTEKLRSCISMKAIICETGGRAPPGQNMLRWVQPVGATSLN